MGLCPGLDSSMVVSSPWRIVEGLFSRVCRKTEERENVCLESGSVEIATAKMTPAIEGVLSSIVVEGKSALDLFRKWTIIGRELGDVERERVRIDETPEESVVSVKDILKARFKWIRAVNALIALLDLDEEIPEETRIRLLSPCATRRRNSPRRAVQGTVPETRTRNARAITANVEKALIAKALDQTGRNVTKAARLLKISRKSLQIKMKELGLRDDPSEQ